MGQQYIIRRYSFLMDLLREGTYLNQQEILEKMHNAGLEISLRSLQRDLAALTDEFGLGLQYDPDRNGYYIDQETERYDVDAFIRFLEVAETADFFIEHIKHSQKALSHICFEQAGVRRGIEHIPHLLEALRNRQKLKLTHAGFDKPASREYVVIPHQLREYMGRWYIVASPENRNNIRCFGIDRIQAVELLKETFQSPAENPAEVFDEVIGLSQPDREVEKVVLSFTAEQAPYVKTLPIHPSQEVLKETDEELRIALYVRPNFELIQTILMHGERVKVIEPDSVAKEVSKRLEMALGRYK